MASSSRTCPLDQQNVELRSRSALALLGIAAAVAPFASVQFPRIDAWIPITNTYIFVADLVTWVLLISQFDIARRPALLVLASGYLYTALMAVPLLLSFPGVFTPSGLFGAGLQTNGWLSAFWVSGYPLAVIGYAVLKDREPGVLVFPRLYANRRRSERRRFDRDRCRVDLDRHGRRTVFTEALSG